MRKVAAALALVVFVGCASTKKADEPLVGAPVAISASETDAKLQQMQTSMTELLERLDVLNDRIAKLEAAGTVTPPPARTAAPAREASPLAAAVESSAAATESKVVESRSSAVAAVEPHPAGAPSKALAGAHTAEIYRTALVQVGQGKLAEARKTFQQVFDAEPTGDLADNALFWIGETYYSAGDYATAMRYYRRVTTEFAEQNKAPDALFKTALCYEKTSDLAMARQTLDEVIQKYPYSSPAASAKYELKRIKY